MKRNAIIRIVCYSVALLVLLGLLLAGLGIGSYAFRFNSNTGTLVSGPVSLEAADIGALQIDWAAGNIIIQTADTDQITFGDEGSTDESNAMTYVIANDKLSISYSQPQIQFGFVSSPSKDLTIAVPQDWVCRELEVDGAALTLTVTGLQLGKLDIDGAACDIQFHGTLESLECDGASCELELVCTDRPKEMDLDGASCRLELTLPAGCGFRVELEGLGCRFRSELDYSKLDSVYRYGDEACHITADGLSCEVIIQESK